MILDEGLENAQARHRACGDRLQEGLQKMGLELFAQEGYRLPELTSVRIPVDRLPGDMDEAGVRRLLLDHYGIEIGGGLGPVTGQIWRIGCMGHTARIRNVTLVLGALGEILD